MSTLCQHAERCPGCPLIHTPYAAGLLQKRARVERALGRYTELRGLELVELAAATAPTGYRVRAKLVTDNQRALGLFAAGSHDVVDIPGCPVLAPELERVAQAIRELLPLELPISAVDLRLADRGVLLTLVAPGAPPRAAVQRVAERIVAAAPSVVGVALSRREQDSAQVLGQAPQVVLGSGAEPHHFAADAPWHYAAHGAFTQVHAGQAALLHERIEAALARGTGGIAGQRVLELYAGAGALGLRLAARGARVTVVERFEPALARLKDAALAQGLELELVASDAAEFLDSLLSEGDGDDARHYDAVLVNPPRRGLMPRVREGIARLAPRRLLYVSCEPETLARDLSQFARLSLIPKRLLALDMIPLSDAVECLCEVDGDAPAAPRVLFEDEHALALFKLPFEPTTPQGEHSDSLLARARRAFSLPELTPVHRLDIGTSGVTLFGKRPADVARLAEALTAGEKTYLALAHGVTHKKGKVERALLEGRTPRPACTRYVRREVVAGHSLLELTPEQGRKHQLRRHLAAIGHPILGDERYGTAAANAHVLHRHGLDRPFLHCRRLELSLGGRQLAIEAELPGDLEAVLASLRASAPVPRATRAPMFRR